MSSLLSVLWTVKPLNTPRPRLFCSGCGKSESFNSSGRFRLNANGKRLDAWLLYRCITCATTWKRPLVERRNLQTLDPAFLQALQSNDPLLAESVAFDLAGLQAFTGQIEVCSETLVRKTPLNGRISGCARLEIQFAIPCSTALRTDRLLARELGLSRGRIEKLERQGRLIVAGPARKKLRRPPVDGMRLSFDLSAESDAVPILSAAIGLED